MRYLNITGRLEFITRLLFFRRAWNHNIRISLPIDGLGSTLKTTISPKNFPVTVTIQYSHYTGQIVLEASLANSNITLFRETYEYKDPEAHLISRWTPVKGMTLRDLKVKVSGVKEF